MKKKTIRQTIDQLDYKVNEAAADYKDLMDQLDTFRGRPLEEKDQQQIRKLVNDIQNVYQEINEVVHFVSYRSEWAANISEVHAEFIKMLIDMGAKVVENSEGKA